MKNQFRRMVMAAGVCSLVGTALLIADDTRGIAEVPFGFTIMNREMPAGTYVIEQINGGQVLKVHNDGTAETVLCLAAARKNGPAGEPRLIFHRYGDRYFLAEVWFYSENSGVGLTKSRAEQALSPGKGSGVLAAIRLK